MMNSCVRCRASIRSGVPAGPDQLTASINICRPERAGGYDLPDATALQLMLPHVAMALEIQAR